MLHVQCVCASTHPLAVTSHSAQDSKAILDLIYDGSFLPCISRCSAPGLSRIRFNFGFLLLVDIMHGK